MNSGILLLPLFISQDILIIWLSPDQNILPRYIDQQTVFRSIHPPTIYWSADCFQINTFSPDISISGRSPDQYILPRYFDHRTNSAINTSSHDILISGRSPDQYILPWYIDQRTVSRLTHSLPIYWSADGLQISIYFSPMNKKATALQITTESCVISISRRTTHTCNVQIWTAKILQTYTAIEMLTYAMIYLHV